MKESETTSGRPPILDYARRKYRKMNADWVSILFGFMLLAAFVGMIIAQLVDRIVGGLH
jgi:hypothetical protein